MGHTDVEKKLKKARELMASGQFVQALALYDSLVEKFPTGYGEYGGAAAESGDFELANRLWEKFRLRVKGDGPALTWLAGEYVKAGWNARAQALWLEAADTDPRNFEIQIKLAHLLTRTSSVEAARPVVNRCLELYPLSEDARFLSLRLDRLENKPDAEQELRRLLASDLKSPRVRYSCLAELAYFLDRAGQYDDAIAILEEGKRFARKHLNFAATREAYYRKVGQELKLASSLPNNILRTWSATFPASVRNAVPPVVFLSGSARSGTTLLERVLDAHPAIAAYDETLAFNKLQHRFDVASSSVPAQRLNVVRELYVKNVAAILGAPVAGKTLVDKNPSRTTWLPSFLRLFPELRVLIALRDPRDIMISLYFQDQTFSNYRTFEEHARHYASIMDAWLAVREWEGLNWLETRYEDVVADLEKEGSRITKFLGLDWHENQARFFDHNREKPIMSNNASDVTKPVYKRAVGRWRAYEKSLAPILPVLEPYCRKFGYE